MRSSILVLFFSILISLGSFSRTAASGAIAADQLVQSAIDQIKETIDTAISNIDNAVDSNTFLAVQRLRLLASELDEIASNNIDRTFQQITQTEQKLLEDSLVVLSSLDDSAENASDEISKVLDDANGLLSTLPFMKTAPRVERFSPSYVVDDGQSLLKVVVSASGYFLDHGKPSLKLSGYDCTSASFTRNNVRFDCSLDTGQINFDSKSEYINGQLRLIKEKGFWEKVTALFSRNDEVKIYDVQLRTVPETLGEFELSAKYKTTVRENQTRTQAFSEGNNHCAGGKNKSFSFSANSGWTIDVNSIQASCSPSSKSACYGVRNVTSTGFQYAARIANNGDCIRVLGKTVARDGRGNVNGRVNWTEYRDVEGERIHEDKGSLLWGKDHLLDLPERTTAFNIRVTQIDGAEKVITGNDTSSKWFSVLADLVARQITIKPKEVDDALK